MPVRRGIPRFVAAALLFAATALADVPPPNQCSTEGARCDTAGRRFDSAGVCTRRTCHRRGEEAGYDCLLCEASDGRAHDGSGLSTVLEGAGVAAALLIVGGAAAFVVARRRRAGP